MAKKKAAAEKISKSAAIRDYKAANASAKPKAIAEALQAEGYDVTPQYVSIVLSAARKKAGLPKSKRGRKPGRPATRKVGRPAGSTKAAAKPSVSVDDLLKVKQLVEASGGVDKARTALDAYARLVG